MNWLLAHVYVVLITLVGFMVVAGGVVYRETNRPSSSEVAQWGRVGGVIFWDTPTPHTPRDRIPNEHIIESEETPYTYIQIQSQLLTGNENGAELHDEWQSLLNSLIEKTSSTEALEPTTDAYSYIPQGLISVPDAQGAMTPQQTELYEYGNRVGYLISSFDEAHTGMLTTLKDAYADRANTAKRDAAIRIGTDYIQLGKEIEGLSEIPTSIAPMHRALARSYQEIGEKMVLKLNTSSDEEFVEAMHVYNASAITFTNNFVALATYLSASGVRFNTTDPGSIFTFRPM